MSVLRIKSYHSVKAIENSARYCKDEEKTTIKGLSEDTYDADLDDNAYSAFNYSANPEKTTTDEKEILVTGIGCKPDVAPETFVDYMNQYYAHGHAENLSPRKARRKMRAMLDNDGNPVLDKNGEMIYDENAPIYVDPETHKTVWQTYMKTPEARTAYMWVLSFPGKKELGYEISPKLVQQISVEFCQKHLADFACVSNVHMNTEHCHAHIMSCAYSKRSGQVQSHTDG